MKPTTWLGNAIAFSFFGILLSTTANAAAVLSGTAQSSKDVADYPRQVILKDLGRITAEEASAHPQPPEPLSVRDYDERKAELARLGGVSLSNAPPPAQPLPINTPGAFVSFSGLDETCSNLIPSDMALATDGNFVM